MVEQYEVYWVELDPTRGGEMAKTRPCVVVTPSDLNMYLTTVVIAPITSTIRNYPYRVLCSVAGREGEIATDQIRTVDKSRIKRKIGELNNREIEELKEVFRQMFCECWKRKRINLPVRILRSILKNVPKPMPSMGAGN